MRRLVLVTMTALGLVLGLGATAQAEPGPTTRAATTAAAEEREITALTAYVGATSSGPGFDAAAALAAGRDPEVVADFVAGFRAATAIRTQQALAPESVAEASRCYGRTAFYRKLTYVELWMDSCDSKSVIALAKAGSSVATIAATILALTGLGAPIAAIVAIAGAIVGLGSAALDYCSRRGNGMIVRNAGWPPCQNQ